MQRVLLGLALILAVYFGVGWLRRALASEEDLVRARFEAMLGAVDGGHPGGVLRGFDRRRYRDDTSGFDFEDVETGLMYLFLHQGVDLEATLDPLDGLTITVDRDATPLRADVRFHFLVEEVTAPGVTRPWWDVRGVGVMEKHDGAWRFVRSSEIDHSTRRRI